MRKGHGLVLEISALVMLAGFGFWGTACNDDGMSPRFSVFAEEPVAESIDVTTQTMFRLRGINGEIEVTGSGSASGIVVTGFRRVYSDTEEDARDRLEELVVETSVTDELVLVETVQPKDAEGRNYVVEYAVILPSYLMVDVVQANGEVNIEDVVGTVIALNVNGDVVAADLGGGAVLATTNGAVRADYAMATGAAIKMTTANGNVELTIPSNTSAWVSAFVANGRISYSGLTFASLTQAARSLTGRLGAGEGSIELRTANGDITLTGS